MCERQREFPVLLEKRENRLSVEYRAHTPDGQLFVSVPNQHLLLQGLTLGLACISHVNDSFVLENGESLALVHPAPGKEREAFMTNGRHVVTLGVRIFENPDREEDPLRPMRLVMQSIYRTSEAPFIVHDTMSEGRIEPWVFDVLRKLHFATNTVHRLH